MTNYLSVLKFTTVSGIPADRVENTMAWTGDDDPDVAAADVNDALVNFYTVANGATHKVGHYLADSLSRTVAPHIDLYELTDLTGVTGIGTPVASRALSAVLPDAEASDNLPPEVAVCLSFHGDLTGLVERSGATRPANRHRGRIFLGPLTTGTVHKITDTKVAEVRDVPRQAICDAAGRIIAGVFGATWCVWSRANAALYPVVGGFVDNAFDTQRRRGVKTTLRTVWPS